MNLAALLLTPAAATPSAPALRGESPATYAELADRSARLAARLVGAGITPGDRVALAAANAEPFVVAYLATLRAGAIAVPLNPASPPAELGREMQTTGPKAVLCDSEAVSGVGSAGVEAIVVSAGGHGLDDIEPIAATVDRADDDVAVLLFTSGTAGPPKAAMLTHGNLAANIGQVQAHPGLAIRPDDIGLGALPFFHVFGLSGALGLTLASGGSLVPIAHFDAAATLEVIGREHVTIVAGVPTMYAQWLAVPDAPADSFASVRLAVSGAAPLPAEVAQGMSERFGVSVYEGYGLTEASPIVTTSALLGGRPTPGSIGPPLPGVDVRLVDADGADVLPGDPGELWCRGPNVFPGYWDDPEATARVLTPDGWLRTGDMAVAGDRGELSLVDRAKDLIIVSGFNVFPAEVEAVLRAHPDVVEAAVVGEPSDRTGEAIVAYVVAEPGRHPSPETLQEFAARALARYKCPTRIGLVDELPRTLIGKVLRRKLRMDV